jgi:hypothetical protein
MITAILPTYNNADIIWLQLESLCAQVNTPEWELIIIEEPSEQYFGEDGLSLYAERLGDAGCVRVVYISVTNWIPLAQKVGDRISEYVTRKRGGYAMRK